MKREMRRKHGKKTENVDYVQRVSPFAVQDVWTIDFQE